MSGFPEREAPLDQFAAYFFHLKKTTRFAFFGGNVEELRTTTKNALLAPIGVHFFSAIFDYKTGEILIFGGFFFAKM